MTRKNRYNNKNRAVNRAIDKAVERASVGSSRQGRYKDPDARAFFDHIRAWLNKADLQEPRYQADTRARDKWMSEFWMQEPHLAGVLNSMVDIDKNRGWSMVGGRNQVRRFTSVLYEAEAGKGWRNYASKQSTSFYTSDFGAPTEIEREFDSPLARMTNLYHVDPADCRLIAEENRRNPEREVLDYYGGGAVQKWRTYDYFRLTSMPSIRADMFGVGFCAVSRCLEIAKLLIAVFEHDKEQLGASAPQGFLTINGYTQEQWDEAMEKRAQEREDKGQLYYNDVMVLVSPGSPIDLKLTSLSQLPGNFDLEKFVQTMMQAYALCFGIDVAEVYSVRAGAALGIGTQSQVQSAKARTKGENSFWLTLQDALRRELPDTVDFEVDQRSDEGDKIAIEARQLEADLIISLYGAAPGNKKAAAPAGGGFGNKKNDPNADPNADPQQQEVTRATEDKNKDEDLPLITRAEARRAIIEAGVLPKGVLSDDNASAEMTDLGIERERVRDNYKIREAARLFPDEPIIRMDHLHREVELWESGASLLRPRYFKGAH